SPAERSGAGERTLQPRWLSPLRPDVSETRLLPLRLGEPGFSRALAGPRVEGVAAHRVLRLPIGRDEQGRHPGVRLAQRLQFVLRGPGLAKPPVERGDDDRLSAAVGEVDVGGRGEPAVHVLLTVDLHRVPHAGHGATRGDGLLQRRGAARLEYLPLAGFDVDRSDAQVAFGVPLRAPEPR